VNLRLTKREIFSRKGPLKYKRITAETAKKKNPSDKSLCPLRSSRLGVRNKTLKRVENRMKRDKEFQKEIAVLKGHY